MKSSLSVKQSLVFRRQIRHEATRENGLCHRKGNEERNFGFKALASVLIGSSRREGITRREKFRQRKQRKMSEKGVMIATRCDEREEID
jgi:hypothetical protein